MSDCLAEVSDLFYDMQEKWRKEEGTHQFAGAYLQTHQSSLDMNWVSASASSEQNCELD